MPTVKTNMRIEVEPSSIIKNITNFFSNEFAFIPELLQNCRRAEANHVDIRINFANKTFEIEDNGHGVMDPKALITIGKSDWSTKTGAEMPAGMGLFSSFKLGNKLSVLSGNWRLEMDFTKRSFSDAASLEYGFPKRLGTQVIIHWDDAAIQRMISRYTFVVESQMADVACELVKKVTRYAAVMPFSTTIKVIGIKSDNLLLKTLTHIAAFDPTKIGSGPVAEAKFPNGRLYFYAPGDLANHPSGPNSFFVSQGVRFAINELDPALNFGYSSTPSDWYVPMIVVADAGTVDFSLPDRDKILKNKKLDVLVGNVSTAMFTALSTALRKQEPNAVFTGHSKNATATAMLRTFDHCFGDRRDELPPELRYVDNKNGFPVKLLDDQLIVEDVARHDDLYEIVREFMNIDELDLIHLAQNMTSRIGSGWPRKVSEMEWAKKLFPSSRHVKSVELLISKDPRSVHFVRVVGGKLRLADKENIALEVNSDVAYFTSQSIDVQEFDELDDIGAGVVMQAADEDSLPEWFASEHMLVHSYAADAAIDGDINFGSDDENIRHCTESELEDMGDDGHGIAWLSSPAYLAIMETNGEFPAKYSSQNAFNEVITNKFDGFCLGKLVNAELSFEHMCGNNFRVVRADIHLYQPSWRRSKTFPVEVRPGVVITSAHDNLVVSVAKEERDCNQLRIVSVTVVPPKKVEREDTVAVASEDTDG